jgi:hypothetical protein
LDVTGVDDQDVLGRAHVLPDKLEVLGAGS